MFSRRLTDLGFRQLVTTMVERAGGVRIIEEDGRLLLASPYDPEAVSAARGIPGRRWDTDRKVNTFPTDQRPRVWSLLRTYYGGRAAIGPADETIKLLKALTYRDVVELSADDDKRATVGPATLNARAAAADFPPLPSVVEALPPAGGPKTAEVDFFELEASAVPHLTTGFDGEAFFDALAAVEYAISTDITREQLNGVFVTAEGDYCATDGHRLARRRGPKLPGNTDGFTIPRKVVVALLRLRKKTGSAIAAGVKHQVAYWLTVSGNGIDLTTRGIEGRFPDYLQVIPKERSLAVRFDRDDVRQKIKVLSIMAADRTIGVGLKLHISDEGMLTMRASHPDLGEVVETVETTTAIAAIHERYIGVNGRYLLETCDALPGSGPVEVSVTDELNPLHFKVPEESGTEVVVMPMRT